MNLEQEFEMAENIHELRISGRLLDPHQILGLKKLDSQRGVVRLWRPDLEKCELILGNEKIVGKKVQEEGLFEMEVPPDLNRQGYQIVYPNGKIVQDPYSFDPVLGELDIHLVRKGLHYELYNFLGATLREHEGVVGTHFAVWAPNALSVSLIGEFNNWDNRIHPMRCLGATGVWELFLPAIGEGERYKFSILTKEGETLIKTDPVAHYGEKRPYNASIVFDVDRYEWTDTSWMEKRGEVRKGDTPLSIYEVHLGSWKKKEGMFLNYRELASQLVSYCKEMGYTHVELFGILEHPLDESWGYQVTGYFAPTSRYGTPEDFQFLVDTLHNSQIGVILDWVPAHFPTDEHSLAKFDGTYLYEHIDPRQGYHPQWNTHIFNYGRFEVSNFLIASALFWLQKMHIDGLRVDAVASMLYLDYERNPGEWIPNRLGTNINLEALEFLKHMNSMIHKLVPDALMMAEESSTFPGITRKVEEKGLGFDFKWSLGWMNDTLRFFSCPFEERSSYIHDLTHIYSYIFDEKYILVLSHDEVVHEKRSLFSKMPGNRKEKVGGVRLLLSFMIAVPGKKLLFMGGDMGQKEEWNCVGEIPWNVLADPDHQKLHQMVKALNFFYRENPALFQADYDAKAHRLIHVDEIQGIIVTKREGGGQTLFCLHHFQPSKLENYQIPFGCQVREIFSTDREEWGGSGILNGKIEQERIDIPPLATLIFAPI